MQQRVQRTIFCVILAVMFNSAAACRRAPVTQQPTPINTAAKPAPQPSACNAENLSRSALLRQTAEHDAKPADKHGVEAEKTK